MAPHLPLYQGARALLATMHGKERVIAPLAARFLGLQIEAPKVLDTDAFGTFSRDVARAGSPLDTARAKIAAAFALVPDVAVALASEGSFGPHPHAPFCALDRELVVLIDRESGLELTGHYATMDTNFAHAVVNDSTAGLAFAVAAGFPAHGVIVMGVREGQPAPELALFKAISDRDTLVRAVKAAMAATGSAHIETDMRAMRNPRRMRAIKRATINLVRRAHSHCPACERPGFGVTERLAGLPCAWCSSPTLLTRAEVLCCANCGYRREKPVVQRTADPMHCEECNP
jgi:hypothetical protein